MKVPEINMLEIFERITDGFFSLNENWCLTYINEAAGRLLFRNRRDLIGKNIWTEFPQSIGLPFYEQYQRAMSEQVPVCFDAYFHPLDTWFEVSAYPSVSGLSVFFKDITEKKRTISQNEQHYKSLFEQNPDAVFSVDVNGNYLSVNKAMTQMLGYTKEELMHLSFKHIVVKEDLDRAYAHYAAACIGVTQNYEVKVKRKNGYIFHVWVTNIPIVVDHEIVGVYGIATDITSRKMEQEKLRKTKERLEALIRNNADAIWGIDIDDRVNDINPAFEKMFGWNASDIIGQELPIIPEFLKSKMTVIHNKVKAGASVVDLETVRQKRDGSLLDVRTTLSPIRNGGGKVIGLTGICRDVTERKKAEELLQNAEKLSVAGQLAAGIAHEIRNPITAIKGFIDLMKSGMDYKKEYFEIMTAEIERIEQILSELLILAKPQASKFKRKNIQILFEQVTTLLDSQAIMNNVEIITQYKTDIDHIHCDDNQLKQVFINFIKNGIEAMPGGGRLQIEVTSKSENSLLIKVIDEGVGIPQEDIEKLGQPFYTTKEKGTGLGFMISKKIIENHSGKVQIKSGKNVGTTIEVELPIIQENGN